MLNIYLKVDIDKKWLTQKLDFLNLKIRLQVRFCSDSRRYHETFKHWNLKIRGLGVKLCVAFLLFLFWKELWRFKIKAISFLLNKNVNFNKNETESSMENPTQSFREMSKVLQHCEFKVKLWWVRAREKRESILCNAYFLSV